MDTEQDEYQESKIQGFEDFMNMFVNNKLRSNVEKWDPDLDDESYKEWCRRSSKIWVQRRSGIQIMNDDCLIVQHAVLTAYVRIYSQPACLIII